ncbi:uncharacterized protein [Nicotiana tomentosiformis]|uniref:uncharacterized protein n=1 Tax=Nicotiana tomentosiformis TaxID=4098 RepID=UPI00388C8362
MPPVDPVEDPIIEESGEVPIAEPTPVDFMSASGFQEVVGGAQPVAEVIPEPRPAAASEPQKLLDRWTKLHPAVFGCERHEDPQDFIDHYKDRLQNMRILESPGVDFTTLQLKGRARRWWQSYLLGRPADRYIPPSQREELRFQFEQLQQGQMSVTDYVARFFELSRHALMILPTDAERRYLGGSRVFISRAESKLRGTKRFRYSGGFSGALSEGSGQFVRGYSSRPTYPVPPPPQGFPVRPYFSAILESSYHPPVIQGSSSGYSGHQGQTSGQQSTVLRGCFECGDPGHMKRFCPKLRGKVVQQGHQSVITAPAAAPVIR